MTHQEPMASDLQSVSPPLATREAWQDEVVQRRHVGGVTLSHPQEPLTIHEVEEDTVFEALPYLIEDNLNSEEASVLIKRLEAIENAQNKTEKPIIGNPFLPDNEAKFVPYVDPQSMIMADPEVQEIIKNRDISGSHQELVEGWPNFQKVFTSGVENGVEQGYVPAIVNDRVKDTLHKTGIRLIDGAIMYTYGPLLAFYKPESDEIGVRHDLEALGESLEINLTHELIHKISGGTFRMPKVGSIEYTRLRAGLSSYKKSGILNRVGLNEAVTQHVALGVMTGDFATLDPDKRADRDTGYFGYRKILAAFIGRSQGVVDAKTVTNAYFEDTGPQESFDLRRKLVREVTAAYGSGALSKLNTLMDLVGTVEKSRLEELVISRIQPTVLDDQGHIVTKGSLNIENLPTYRDIFEAANT